VDSPQLCAVRAEFEAATERARGLVEHHDAPALRRMTSAGGWSALQCLTHLSLTTANYLPLLARALEDAPSARGSLRFANGQKYPCNSEPVHVRLEQHSFTITSSAGDRGNGERANPTQRRGGVVVRSYFATAKP
jgi:hypothetical protein